MAGVPPLSGFFGKQMDDGRMSPLSSCQFRPPVHAKRYLKAYGTQSNGVTREIRLCYHQMVTVPVMQYLCACNVRNDRIRLYQF